MLQNMLLSESCWSNKLNGKYIKEGHGSSNAECLPYEDAKKKCVESSDCHGITFQSNACGGLHRVVHAPQATLLPYSNWIPFNLHAYTLDRKCLAESKLL